MRKIIHKYYPFLIIFILSITVIWPVFLPGYFSHHDDLQVMRIFEMKRCILDLQIPCRWVPDMGYGNGYPLFNYYSVLPYYIGGFLSFVLGFLTSAKTLFAIPLILGGIFMYLLSNELFGIYPAILSATLYTFAPYRALDTYVRGDVTESFAIAFVPLIFYFALRLIKKGEVKYIIALSLSLGLFLTSHNIMILLFMPQFFVVVLYWLISEGRKNFLKLAISFLIGIGLAAFFIIPAYFEKNLVQIDNLIRLDLDFRAHFATLNQLFFDRTWGYGASVPGPNDTISFQIGWPHWWLVILAGLTFLFGIKKEKKATSGFALLFLGIFLYSIFMTHIKSAFIWEKIDILKFTQFPWRFLSLSIFASSLLGGYFANNFKLLNTKYAVTLLVILTVVLNWSFFKPKEFYPDLTDQEKLSGSFWEDQQKAAIFDYLPNTAIAPTEKAPENPIVISGKAKVSGFENKSNSFKFQAQTEGQSVIEVPVFDFPNWQITINNHLVKFSNKNYLGRIDINLENAGNYTILGKFTNTPIRAISNIISILSIVALIVLIFYDKHRKNFN